MTTKDTMECHKKAIAKCHNGAKFDVQREKFVEFFHFENSSYFNLEISLQAYDEFNNFKWYIFIFHYDLFSYHLHILYIKISKDLLFTILYGRENQI